MARRVARFAPLCRCEVGAAPSRGRGWAGGVRAAERRARVLRRPEASASSRRTRETKSAATPKARTFGDLRGTVSIGSPEYERASSSTGRTPRARRRERGGVVKKPPRKEASSTASSARSTRRGPSASCCAPRRTTRWRRSPRPKTTSRSSPRYQMYLPIEEELRAELAREREAAERALRLAASANGDDKGSELSR